MYYCSHVRATCHQLFHHTVGISALADSAQSPATAGGCPGLASSDLPQARFIPEPEGSQCLPGRQGEEVQGGATGSRDETLSGYVCTPGTPWACQLCSRPAPACTPPVFPPLGPAVISKCIRCSLLGLYSSSLPSSPSGRSSSVDQLLVQGAALEQDCLV